LNISDITFPEFVRFWARRSLLRILVEAYFTLDKIWIHQRKAGALLRNIVHPVGANDVLQILLDIALIDGEFDELMEELGGMINGCMTGADRLARATGILFPLSR
jgi:hypothetical protein